MNDIDQLLTNIGLTDPTNRATIRAQVEAYALELAISKLLDAGDLSDADNAALQRASEAGGLDTAALDQLFPDGPRQQILQDSLSESLNLVIDTAREQASN